MKHSNVDGTTVTHANRTESPLGALGLVMLLSLAPAAGAATILDTMCLSKSAPALLSLWMTMPGSSHLADSLGINPDSIKIQGTCDSVVFVYPIKIGPITTSLPIVTLKKVNSCTLSVAYIASATDTLINLCAIQSVLNPLTAGMHAGAGFGLLAKTGSGLVLSWNPAEAPLTRVMCIGLDGTQVFSAVVDGHAGSLLVPLKRRSGTLLVVGETAAGRKIAGRITL